MKKEYQYLIAGVVVSAAVLLGMGVVGDEKQVTEGRYEYIPNMGSIYSTPIPSAGNATNTNLFGVLDSQTGTVSYVDVSGQSIAFPFAATKAE